MDSLHGNLGTISADRRIAVEVSIPFGILARPVVGLLLWTWPLAGHAQLHLLPGQEPQKAFGGDGQRIELIWRNAGTNSIDTEIRARVYQVSAGSAAQLFEAPWKRLRMLPEQTLLESATLNFPAVRGETRYLIQWIDAKSQVIGKTAMVVYPPDLLKELKTLAGDDSLGVVDLQNQLKPLLKSIGVGFVDLEAEPEAFHGRLAIVGPFASKEQVTEALVTQIGTLAAKGAAIVWIQPPHAAGTLKPSFSRCAEGEGSVVIAQAGLVPDLTKSAEAQVNLLELARFALRPPSETVRFSQVIGK